MQTRSSSSSSVATGATRRQYNPEEINIIMKKMNDKEKQLKEQVEALQIKQDHLSKLQKEIEQRNAFDTNETTQIMNSIVYQMEKLSQRITNIETSRGEDEPHLSILLNKHKEKLSKNQLITI